MRPLAASRSFLAEQGVYRTGSYGAGSDCCEGATRYVVCGVHRYNRLTNDWLLRASQDVVWPGGHVGA